MSARIDRAGNVFRLDRQAEPDEVVSEEDARDPSKLSRLLMRLLKDVAGLRRRFAPRHLDFEDREVDATGVTKYRFPHNFNAPARWWVVRVSGGTPALYEHPDTDLRTLVLLSDAAVTVTVRVEEAG